MTNPLDDPEVRAWIDSRAPAIRDKVLAYPPWLLYRMKSTGQSCRVEAYEEALDGTCETCRVTVWQEWAPALTIRQVFGIPFTDLERAPDADEVAQDGSDQLVS